MKSKSLEQRIRRLEFILHPHQKYIGIREVGADSVHVNGKEMTLPDFLALQLAGHSLVIREVPRNCFDGVVVPSAAV